MHGAWPGFTASCCPIEPRIEPQVEDKMSEKPCDPSFPSLAGAAIIAPEALRSVSESSVCSCVDTNRSSAEESDGSDIDCVDGAIGNDAAAGDFSMAENESSESSVPETEPHPSCIKNKIASLLKRHTVGQLKGIARKLGVPELAKTQKAGLVSAIMTHKNASSSYFVDYLRENIQRLKIIANENRRRLLADLARRTKATISFMTTTLANDAST